MKRALYSLLALLLFAGTSSSQNQQLPTGQLIGRYWTDGTSFTVIKIKRNHTYVLRTYSGKKLTKKTWGHWNMDQGKLVLDANQNNAIVLEEMKGDWYVRGRNEFTAQAKFTLFKENRSYRSNLQAWHRMRNKGGC